MVRYRVVVEGRTYEIEVGPEGQVWVDRRPVRVDLEGMDGNSLCSLLVEHRSYEAQVELTEDGESQIIVAGRPYRARLEEGCLSALPFAPRRKGAGSEDPHPQEIRAPLPGLLVEVRVRPGERVAEGDVVAVLESMKMHLELRAPRTGVVRALFASADREVAQGETLAVIEPL